MVEQTASSDVWRPDLSARHFGHERIEHVAFVPMPPALRNELITEAYGDLADSMRMVLGSDDATWCTFGQWASHAVGDVLRLPGGSVGRLIAAAFGDGNRLVFADVGRAHSVFLETVGVTAGVGGDLDAAWERCLVGLTKRTVAPPSHPMQVAPPTARALLLGECGGPDDTDRALLVRGFRAYREALDIDDPVTRSQTILLGNALIAVHEQQRLAEAITIGFRSWLRNLTTSHRPFMTRYRWRNRDPRRWRLSLEDRWIGLATGRFIGIDLPDRRLEVGKPLPTGPITVQIPTLDTTATPPMADRSLDAIPNDQLLAVVYDTFAVDGRPATCWPDLGDRMAYILRMFANEQRSSDLITPEGLLRRPIPRPDLEDELDAFEKRLAQNDPVRGPMPVAVLDGAQLDVLRATPTHRFADAVTGMAFQEIGRRRDSESGSATGPMADLDAEFRTRIDTVCGPGGLLDSATIDHSTEMFRRWNTMIYMGLLFRSLPDGYAAAKGVKVLGTISDLATDPVRRIGETGQFLRDVFETPSTWHGPPGDRRLDPRGPGAQSIFGVRLLHALVARRLLDDVWDTEHDGFPINQEDLLGTALSFVVPVLEMFDDLGIELEPEQREAYTRVWCAIGHLLGLPLDVVTAAGPDGRRPLTSDEALDLARLIRWRHHNRSLDGVRLGEALVAGVADGFPRMFDWVGPGLFHAVGSTEVNRILLATERRGRKRSEVVAATIGASLRSRHTKVVARSIVRVAGKFWLEPFLAEGASRPYRRPLAEAEADRLRPDPRELDLRYWPLGWSS